MTRKIFFACLAASLSLLPAFAVDFGGILSNSTKFAFQNKTEVPLEQQNSLSGWLRQPFSKDGSHYLAAEALLEYTYKNQDLRSETDNTHTPLVDLTLLKYNYTFKIDPVNTLIFSFGRFPFSDSTGLVFNQASDGFLVDYRKPKFHGAFYGGYTGLLNALNVSMIDGGGNKDKWYNLAAPFVVLSGAFSFPYLFLNQTLGFELLGFVATGTNSASTKYLATASLNGPITPKLFYTLTTTFANQKKTEFTNLTQFSLGFFPGVKDVFVSWNSVIATGENGPFKPFTAISSSTPVYSVESKEYSDLTKTGLAFSVKPISVLVLGAGVDIILNSIYTNPKFSGVQWNASVGTKPVGDLSLSLSAKQFIDTAKTGNDKLEFTFRASLAF